MSQEQYARLAKNMQNEALAPYIEHLSKRRLGLALKRGFDILSAGVCLAALSPFYIASAIAIKIDSKGPVFYYQERVGKDCKKIRIIKFRTMVTDADKIGQLTVGEEDERITGAGKILRDLNFDEFPQMINVLKGDMSVVGMRPEVPKYVEKYGPEDYATLLVRPGMASLTAIYYRHESEMLGMCDGPERAYLEEILPAKMKLNREYVKNFSFLNDIGLLLKTVFCVFTKDKTLEKFRKSHEK
jgi:lipopolysaccharide/colanic/teichoic acid biosynthesis glycosyltransferase